MTAKCRLIPDLIYQQSYLIYVILLFLNSCLANHLLFLTARLAIR
jgi:hypothetical protein